MSRVHLQFEPEQLELWPTNIHWVNFRLRYCEDDVSPPLNNPTTIVDNWFMAKRLEAEDNKQRYQRWKEDMYSIRCMIGQFRLRAFKRGNQIIVERIPFKGAELRFEMDKRKMRVVK